MEKLKKAFMLLIVIAFAVLTSCSNKQEPPSDQNVTERGAGVVTAGGESAAAPEFSIFDMLPANNFGEMEFTVYVPPNPDSPVDKGTFVEELTGEAFNDAVFNRNRKVEDQYNVKIGAVYGANWDSALGDLKKDVNAGDLRADVYFTHVINGVAAMASDGLLRTWDAVPHLDFGKPWWNQTIIKNLNIANKTFYTAGSMSIHDPLLLVFNKDLLRDLGLEDPYAIVRDGRWTLDKLSEMATAAIKDLNGDGVMNYKDDQFGLEYGIQWQTPALMYACGEISVTLDGSGYPAIDMLSPKKIDAYEKIFNLLWDGDKTYCFIGNTPATANHPHIGTDSGRVLFCQYNLFTVENLRATEVEYGILPLPKLSESQPGYMTNSWTGMYGLPAIIDEGKFEMMGTVMEAMSALGHSGVIPVYYDILLKEKLTRDEDSREMLDMILNTMVFDLGLNFQTGSSQPGFFVTSLLQSKKPNYVSEVEKTINRMESDYEKLYNKIVDMDN